jgi:hypothetical protein
MFFKKYRTDILVFTIISVLLVFIFWSQIRNSFSNPGKKIENLYQSNLCLLSHDFVYTVSFNSNDKNVTVYLVKNETGQFDLWESNNNSVGSTNSVTCTALIIDPSGTCITSKYAVQPWHNETDISALKRLFSEQLRLSYDDIIVDGLSINMKVQLNPEDTLLSERSFNCRKTLTNDLSGYNIEILEPVKKPWFLILPEVKYGMLNETIYLLDFSSNDLANGYFPGHNVSKLTSLQSIGPQGYYIESSDQFVNEGAPVFNKKAELVGIYSNFDLTLFQSRSMKNFVSSIPYHNPENTVRYDLSKDSTSEILNISDGITLSLDSVKKFNERVGIKTDNSLDDDFSGGSDNRESELTNKIHIEAPLSWELIKPTVNSLYTFKCVNFESTAICEIKLSPLNGSKNIEEYVLGLMNVLKESLPDKLIGPNIYQSKIGDHDAYGFSWIHNVNDTEEFIAAVKGDQILILNFQKMYLSRDSEAMKELLKSVNLK